MIAVRRLLRRIFLRHGLTEQFREQEPLFLWEEAVGEKVARLTAPLQARQGIMFIEVGSHVLAQELSMFKEDYIGRLNELLGDERVRDIRFRVGQVSRPRREPQLELEEVSLTLAEEEQIAQLVSNVEDGRLRSALRGFFITERRIERVREARGFARCPRCGVLHRGEDELCFHCQLESGEDDVLE